MKTALSQDDFDRAIGRLDRILSELVGYGKWNLAKSIDGGGLDDANIQTLKHHAEDMIAAGNKILRDIGCTPASEFNKTEPSTTPSTE